MADHADDQPHFEECHCSILTDTTPLPITTTLIPTPSDPVVSGQCIYHHRLSTRDAETAIFIQLAPEIDELKEVISSGMVKFKTAIGGQVVLKKATTEQMSEAQDSLKVLIQERERLVKELWSKFVARWGGRVERRDDGTMFVVDRANQGDEAGEDSDGKGKTKAKMEEQVADDEADPYVKRMREVQARMDDLKVADERKQAKRARAGKAAEEYTS
jgi:hypothetical protein